MNRRALPFGLVAGALFSSTSCYDPVLVECVVACRSEADCPRPLRCEPSGFCGRDFTCSPRSPIDAGDDSPIDSPVDTAADTPIDTERDLGNDGVYVSFDDSMEGGGFISDASDEVLPSVLPDQLSQLVLWLDGDANVSTSPTFQWGDRSPVHNDATQTPEVAPIPVPDLVPGHAGLHFYGEGQYLQLPSGFADFTAGLTAFVVVRPSLPHASTDTNASRFFDLAASLGSLSDAIVFARNGVDATDLLFQVFASVDTWTSIAPAVVENNVLHMYGITAGGGEPGAPAPMTYYRDGVALKSGTTFVPTVIERTSNLIGRSNHWLGGAPIDPDLRGDLGEMVLYNRQLSDDERQRVERYLMGKWDLSR